MPVPWHACDVADVTRVPTARAGGPLRPCIGGDAGRQIPPRCAWVVQRVRHVAPLQTDIHRWAAGPRDVDVERPSPVRSSIALHIWYVHRRRTSLPAWMGRVTHAKVPGRSRQSLSASRSTRRHHPAVHDGRITGHLPALRCRYSSIATFFARLKERASWYSAAMAAGMSAAGSGCLAPAGVHRLDDAAIAHPRTRGLDLGRISGPRRPRGRVCPGVAGWPGRSPLSWMGQVASCRFPGRPCSAIGGGDRRIARMGRDALDASRWARASAASLSVVLTLW